MKIYRPEDRKQHEELWSKYHLSILQSWNWNEVKAKSSEVVRVRLGSYPTTLFVKTVPLLGFRFGYIPHGGPKELFKDTTVRKLEMLMKEHSLSHILIDPYVPSDKLPNLPDGLCPSGEHWVQTQDTIVTDLLESDGDMLARMRRKHRQYIRKSERKGLIFETDDSLEGAERFGKLMEKQYTTKNFLTYPSDYFVQIWQSFEDSNRVHIHFAVKQGEDMGAYLVIDGSDRVFQFFGGTTEEGRNDYGAYLLTWKSMLAARDRGFTMYDQWGTAPYNVEHQDYEKSDEKYGISVFKEGFSGNKIHYKDQLVVVDNNLRFKVYRLLIKLHRAYIQLRKKLT